MIGLEDGSEIHSWSCGFLSALVFTSEAPKLTLAHEVVDRLVGGGPTPVYHHVPSSSMFTLVWLSYSVCISNFIICLLNSIVMRL